MSLKANFGQHGSQVPLAWFFHLPVETGFHTLTFEQTYLFAEFSTRLPHRQDYAEKIIWLCQKLKLYFLMKFVLESLPTEKHI